MIDKPLEYMMMIIGLTVVFCAIHAFATCREDMELIGLIAVCAESTELTKEG